jgi:hypothetical protein
MNEMGKIMLYKIKFNLKCDWTSIHAFVEDLPEIAENIFIDVSLSENTENFKTFHAIIKLQMWETNSVIWLLLIRLKETVFCRIQKQMNKINFMSQKIKNDILLGLFNYDP